MDESVWRAAALAILLELRWLLPASGADALERELRAALALPRGQARRSLRTALTANDATRVWLRRWRESGTYRSVADAPPEVMRHLSVEAPAQAPVGRRFNVFVRVLRAAGADNSTRLRPFGIPEDGARLTITVSAPGLVPVDDSEARLVVPAEADSDPLRFAFVGVAPGQHRVTVRAFLDGSFVGETTSEVLVAADVTTGERPAAVAEMHLLAEPGEVTLQILRTAGRYSFQLIGPVWYPVELSAPDLVDPLRFVDGLVAELSAIAGDTDGFDTNALRDRRLRTLGATLWRDVVPAPIRRQLHEWRDQIGALTIISDLDPVPWELLYAADPGHDGFFLAEQFPLVRRTHGQQRVRRLRLGSAAYVVPDDAPDGAAAEADSVRATLGDQVRDLGTVGGLEPLLDLIGEGAFDLLHFACHCDRSPSAETQVSLSGGHFRPSDLSLTVAQRGLQQAAPLIFFNASRSARQAPGLTTLNGWAGEFLNAGAGAFVGSLWGVRTGRARLFVDAFYDALVGGRSLGHAALAARLAARGDGDPTWLSYSVYGSPAAVAVRREELTA